MSKNAELLNYVRNELGSIIRELNDISSGMRNNFQGIGSERCADVISNVAVQYHEALRKLNRIDASKL